MPPLHKHLRSAAGGGILNADLLGVNPMSHQTVWKSVSELQNCSGKLYFEGCDVRSLAKEFGTPLYLYSQNRILANYHRLLNAYRSRYPKFGIFYAVKANNNPAIVKLLGDAGAGADASCTAEIRLAQRAGIAPENILYSGVYNSDRDLQWAVEQGVRLNLEDISQLERLAKFHVPSFLSFRVNPGLGSSGAEGLVFAGPEAKFGIPEHDIERAYARAKELGVKRFGIHMMTGSNILSPDYFEEVVERLLDLAGPIGKRLGIQFDFIDIGGSLGVPYRPEEEELDVDYVAERVVRQLRRKLKEYAMGEPLLLHEPGRYLVCDAGILIASVTSIKRAERTFVGLDAGMQTLLRPALYGAYHHILYADNLDVLCDKPVQVVGQVCENTDVLAKDRPLPANVAVDDLMAILNTGSYGFCMSSQYNSQPRAAEVLLNNGRAKLIRRRETYEDLITHTIEN